MIGRDDLLGKMAERLDAIRDGAGHIVRIHGGAGVGKSHLTAVFGEQAQAQNCRVAMSGCHITSQGAAYYPWRQLFRSLFGLLVRPDQLRSKGNEPSPAAEDLSSQIEWIRSALEQLNPDWLVRLPLLGDLLGLPIPDNATTAALEPRLRQEALFALVAEILATWSQAQPLVLILDDAHWMDEASLALTRSLALAVQDKPVMILLAHRPDPSSAGEREASTVVDLTRLAHCHPLELDELAASSIRELAARRLQGRPSPLLLSVIEARAHGNPFFVEELVDALLESRQVLQERDGTWDLAPEVRDRLRSARCLVQVDGHWLLSDEADMSIVNLDIPDSIHGLVLSRIDRLPEAHKLTLKVAGVIGRRFELNLLNRSHPDQPGQQRLQQQVQDLETRDLVHPDQDWYVPTKGRETFEPVAAPVAEVAPAYQFKHHATQEVAYDTLLYAQRQQLHCAVSQALAILRPDAVEQIAYHAYAGQD